MNEWINEVHEVQVHLAEYSGQVQNLENNVQNSVIYMSQKK